MSPTLNNLLLKSPLHASSLEITPATPTNMTSVARLQSLSSVPKLETNGSNWIIFQTRLKWALRDKQVLKSQPILSKMKAHQLLAHQLYDSTMWLTKLLHQNHHTTVAEMWAVITQEFSVKSSHVVAATITKPPFGTLAPIGTLLLRAQFSVKSL